MSTLVNLSLAPFAAIMRASYARPWLAILVSSAAAVVAYFLHREMWLSFFACFASYMLMWIDEHEHPQPTEMGTADNVE